MVKLWWCGNVYFYERAVAAVSSINWDVAFVVHILVGIVAAFMYKEYEVDSHVDSVVL